jgi:hypothetical protein
MLFKKQEHHYRRRNQRRGATGGATMRRRLWAAAALLVIAPAAASAAPAAERRAAAAEVHVTGADGASFRIELLLTQILPSSDAVLDAAVTRCVRTDCTTIRTRLAVPGPEFALAEDGSSAALATTAFGTALTAAWSSDGPGSTTLLTTRAARSGAGAAAQETTRPARAWISLAGVRCSTSQAQLQTAPFVGAADTITEQPADHAPPGLTSTGGKAPRCAPA